MNNQLKQFIEKKIKEDEKALEEYKQRYQQFDLDMEIIRIVFDLDAEEQRKDIEKSKIEEIKSREALRIMKEEFHRKFM